MTLALAAGLLWMNRDSVRREALPPPTVSHLPEPAPAAAPAGAGFIGVVVADGSVELSASLAARLDKVAVRVGDRVRKGSVLAQQDVRALEHELAINQAGLQMALADEEVARLALVSAQESLQRGAGSKLVDLGAISEEERARLRYAEQTAAAKLNAAQAQVQNQRARVEQLRLRISEASLRAPFDGRVARRYLDPGTMVAAGSPILHLISEGPQLVRLAIPEEEAARVTVGTPVRLSARGQARELRGRVENVAPEVDAASRMVLAIASVTQEDGALLPFGSVVQVFVEDAERVGQRPVP
ncbi:efflux RND transporter periplasmic adaptor subunit [Archangium gephyra]|uniref:efflux RND transporter periplasmic adaptor subunit n=1 Tax=Archangium gephyra TaxID=48 RepID=UPI003B7EBC2F